jgi:cyclase
MIKSRVIPCLLVQNNGLVKTVEFGHPKYVGDPINAVRIYNEKEVDELIVLDIGATVRGLGPNFRLIEQLARECRMPLTYGGGISNVDDARRIVGLGVEKISLSSAVFNSPNLIDQIGDCIGLQSVCVVIDVRTNKSFFGSTDYEVYTHNGSKRVNRHFRDILTILNEKRIGEIVINNIDRDGSMIGYDFDLIDIVRNAMDMPMTILGGARDYGNLKEAVNRYKTLGVAAGSLFVFKGKYKAVLISYPNKEELNEIQGIN